MKHGVMITLAGAAALAAAVAGCSSNSAGGQKVSTSGHAKVVVDSQDQNVTGPVTCQKADGQLQIGIGQPGSPNVVAVQATDAEPPVARQISLGTVNGVALAYQQGSPGASAQAARDGNGYKFTGTATGLDKTNPMAGLVSKSFEVDATCP
ncbi:MAG: lipoprotein LpqH [Mycobacteriaceae bacterium]|nr:lipoprotein LpqH [Mycobacteriaceae bacterium]MBV9639990.1 lipoprotein LpqH [Mycobacteriaceae bacterium]